VLSVAVDIRENSKTFGKYKSIELNDTLQNHMFIPRGFAHGYVTLSDESIFIYKVDEYFNLDAMRGIAFDDEDLNIDWKMGKNKIINSDKDSNNPKFKDLEYYKGNYE
jgi:dTDP-4-dehydrorhamnose 3,5-epimerase